MTRRTTRGLKPHETGQSFENLLDFAHDRYWTRHRFWVKHNGIKGIWRSRPGHGREFTPAPDKAAPDYYGCIAGRFIAFDAKSTQNTGRWKLYTDSRHQYDHLIDLARAEAVCWFAIEAADRREVYLVRVDPEHYLADRQPSIGLPPDPDDAALTIPQNEYGWYDYLPVLQSHWLG